MAWRVSDRTNFWLHVSEGAFASFGMGLMGVGSVLPVLVDKLGGGALVIGSLGTIAAVASLVQVLAARFVEPMRRKKPWVMVTGLGMRLPYVVVPAALLALGASQPRTVLYILLTTLVVGAVSGSLLIPGWLEMVRATIPERLRGRLFGYRQFFSSLMGLVSGVLVAWVLAALEFPQNFAAVGGLAAAAVTLSWFLYLGVNDVPASSTQGRVPWGEYFGELGRALRERADLRQYLLYVVFAAGSGASFVFMPTALTKGLGLSAATVGYYMALGAGVRVVGSPLAGWLADHLGPRRLLPSGALLMAAALVVAASAQGFAGGLCAYGLVSAGKMLQMVCRPPVVMELAHGRGRVAQLVLPSLVAWPVRTVGPLVAALVVRWAGYPTLFGLAAGVGLLAVWASTSLARSAKTTP